MKHKRDAEALSVYMSEPFPLIPLISSPSSAPRKPTKQPRTSLLEETFSSKTEFSEGITRCMYESLLIDFNKLKADNLTLKKELGSRDRLSAPTNTSRRVGQELRRLQGCIELWRCKYFVTICSRGMEVYNFNFFYMIGHITGIINIYALGHFK